MELTPTTSSSLPDWENMMAEQTKNWCSQHDKLPKIRICNHVPEGEETEEGCLVWQRMLSENNFFHPWTPQFVSLIDQIDLHQSNIFSPDHYKFLSNCLLFDRVVITTDLHGRKGLFASQRVKEKVGLLCRCFLCCRCHLIQLQAFANYSAALRFLWVTSAMWYDAYLSWQLLQCTFLRALKEAEVLLMMCFS